MTDNAATVRDQVSHIARGCRASTAHNPAPYENAINAALDALVAERDEAQAKFAEMKACWGADGVRVVREQKAINAQVVRRAESAEARAERLRVVYVLDYLDYPESGGGIEAESCWTTEDAAIIALKARYGSPYRVVWSEERDRIDQLVVTGKFDHVQHYSYKHTGKWAVREIPVNATPGEAGNSTSSPHLARIRAVAAEQAEDEVLWGIYPMGQQPILEAYLQQELRRLHAVIEKESCMQPTTVQP